jgi:hypothetical protein
VERVAPASPELLNPRWGAIRPRYTEGGGADRHDHAEPEEQ